MNGVIPSLSGEVFPIREAYAPSHLFATNPRDGTPGFQALALFHNYDRRQRDYVNWGNHNGCRFRPVLAIIRAYYESFV